MDAPWYAWLYLLLFLGIYALVSELRNLAAFKRPVDLLVAWTPLLGIFYVFLTQYTSVTEGTDPLLASVFGLSLLAFTLYAGYDALLGALSSGEDGAGVEEPSGGRSTLAEASVIHEGGHEIEETDLDVYGAPVDPVEIGSAIGSLLSGSEEEQRAAQAKLEGITEAQMESSEPSLFAAVVVVALFAPMVYMTCSVLWKTWFV